MMGQHEVTLAEIGSLAAGLASEPSAALREALVHHALLGVTPAEAAASLAAEIDLPARLFSTLLRVATSVLPAPVAQLDTTPPDISTEDEPSEPGWDADGLQEFLRHAASHTVLTFEQEQELGAAIEEGRLAKALLERGAPDQHLAHLRHVANSGRSAEDELARHNIRLVVSIAHRLKARCTPAFGLEDLIEEGYIGLAKAIEKWDYRRGLKFSTYATWWIRQNMERALGNQAQVVRVPIHMQDRIVALWKLEHGPEAPRPRLNDQETADRLGISVEQLAATRSYVRKFLSLDAPAGGSTVALGALLPDPKGADAFDELDRLFEHDIVDRLFELLTDREIEILNLRFGLDGGDRHTLETVGRRFGLTRERIRQIEEKALKRLRSAIQHGDAGSDLRDDMERRVRAREEKASQE